MLRIDELVARGDKLLIAVGGIKFRLLAIIKPVISWKIEVSK